MSRSFNYTAEDAADILIDELKSGAENEDLLESLCQSAHQKKI